MMPLSWFPPTPDLRWVRIPLVTICFTNFSSQVPVLIDQGTADSFLEPQLKPKNFFLAAAKNGYNVELRMQPLYDHSYYFISTFMRDHIDHHARALGLRKRF